MERLTYQDYEQILVKGLDIVGIGEKNADILTNAIEKLSYYEDLEEQGRLIELPCKIGSNMYSVEKWFDNEEEYAVFHYVFDGVEKAGLRLLYNNQKEDVCVFGFDELNISLFLSKEEAEEKLTELEADSK